MPERRNHKRFSRQTMMLSWLVLLVLGGLLVFPGQALAAEMVTNGEFNTGSSWSFDPAGGNGTGVTSGYDGATTRTGGSGSARVYVPLDNRNKSGQGVIRQNVSITAGSTIDTASVYTMLSANNNTGDNITIDLRYADLTTVNVLSTGELTNTAWQQFSATPGTVLAQDVDQIIVTLNVKNANNTTNETTIWADEISIGYTATAGCSSAVPTLDLGVGVSIGASASTQYTIIITNNDSGVGCSDRSFDVVFDNETMTPNDGSFNASSLSGTCNPTLAAGASSTTCKLDVTSTGGAVNGTQLATTVIDNISSETGSVTTTISVSSSSCGLCHNYPPTDGTRALATGAVEGSHQVHASGWLTAYLSNCANCHTDTTASETKMAHRSGDIEMAGTIEGGTYSKVSPFAQIKNPTMGTCDNTACHGSSNPTWGGAAMTCSSCHNDGGGNEYPTSTSQFRSAAAAGVHETHMTATSTYMSGGVVCEDCHTTYGAASDANHFDVAAPADVPFPTAGDADLNSTGTSYSGGNCTVYCHGANMPGGDTSGTNRAPAWTDTFAGGCTDSCHGLPPATGTHSGYTYPTGCDGCHSTVNAAGAIATVAQHINGTTEVSGCTGCHGSDPKEYPPVSYWGTDKNTADGVGAHVTHMENTTSLMTKENVTGESSDHWCAECHTTTRGAGGHDDGYPAEVSFANATEAKYAGTSAAFSAEGGGSAGPDTGVGGSCTVYCHGVNMPNGDTTGTNRNPSWGDNLTGCATCHGFPPTPGGTHNGITAETQCGGCHDATMTNGVAGITDKTLHINSSVDVNVSCTGCHNGGGPTAKLVSVDSPHSTNTIPGSPTCESCHFASHAARTTGTFGIPWDSRTMGTDYTADGKIYIVGAGSEAESCWACHEGQTPDVSEWDGSNAVYDYGSVTQGDLNWFTTSWSSSNFNYKSGPLTTAMGSSASTHGTNGGASGVDVAGEVSCTSCHDVHGINNNGVSTTSAPYLRGSWKASPYYEDGAPGEYNNSGGGSGTSNYINHGNYGLVPRASNAITNGMGGYWIDQNSGNPNNGTYATHAGLCTLCHGDGDTTPAEATDVTFIEGLWAGHKNTVAGGNDDGSGARNIFSNTIRIGDGVWNSNGGGAYMGNQSFVTPRDTKPWAGSIRNADYGDGVSPTVSGKALAFNNFAWTGLSVDDNSVDSNFHSFTCSKCHNPHASRLPKLMITNCLDTSHNTWEDSFTGDTNWDNNNYDSQTYGTKKFSNASTAQNCHRYIPGQETSGWNTTTPW